MPALPNAETVLGGLGSGARVIVTAVLGACDPQHIRYTALSCVISHHNWGISRTEIAGERTRPVGYHTPPVRILQATKALGHRCPFLSHRVASAHGLQLGTQKKRPAAGLGFSKWT
jgi:hypothetical protein